jgi:hypothetical protein
VAYLLVERRVRRRTWKEFGLKREGYLKGLIANWPIIMAVIFVVQFVTVWVVGAYVPTFLQHIYSRIP